MKTRILSSIENIVNEHKKKELYEFYGEGSKIKVTSLGYSTNSKSLFVEAKITLGAVITEDLLDTSLAEILIGDAVDYLYPYMTKTFIITWDS